jgi:hypothetical protein
MNMRAWATGVLLFVVAGSAVASSPFRVTLVPTKSDERGQIISAANNPGTFYVVLINDSPKAEVVWESWNSWGYDAISFEVTSSDGTTRHLSKKKQIFTRNFPTTFSIPPAGCQVYPIQFDSTWANVPSLFPSLGDVKVTVQAIYEVQSSQEAGEYGVWVGRTVSPKYVITLRH